MCYRLEIFESNPIILKSQIFSYKDVELTNFANANQLILSFNIITKLKLDQMSKKLQSY
jgi:hypothetical protein